VLSARSRVSRRSGLAFGKFFPLLNLSSFSMIASAYDQLSIHRVSQVHDRKSFRSVTDQVFASFQEEIERNYVQE
jgi:hypothetical protein